jgi:CheY-like chemotaxis protein
VGEESLGTLILIAEESADTRMVLQQALEMYGYRVVEATNGLEAIRVARRECPRLILIDLYIPALDGFVTTSLLRKHPETRDVPIIAVSAYDSTNERADAEDAGVTSYLTEPVDLESLRGLICRLLGND